jgi:hypothetical protein
VALLLLLAMSDPVMADEIFVDSDVKFSCSIFNLSKG